MKDVAELAVKLMAAAARTASSKAKLFLASR
jgi:hypothetical protein